MIAKLANLSKVSNINMVVAMVTVCFDRFADDPTALSLLKSRLEIPLFFTSGPLAS